MGELRENPRFFNKYEDTFDDLFNSSDKKSPNKLKSLDWPESIGKGTCNALTFRSKLPTFLEKNCEDENVLTPKI